MSMPQYDFKSLSPIDFEILVRDLLQKELKIILESFKAGRDAGIDFRYARGAGTLIVQCKHYAESTYATLLSTVKRESDKVHKLNPKRYILATSLGLTPQQKSELENVLHPFVRTPGDIFSRDDLNNLLALFPEVERHTPKLWLSSTAVFEEILRSKVRNVSRESLEKIRERSKLYVQNSSFADALSILDEHNLCIIAGIPGIGKTTLAEMLVLHFVKSGYELVQIDHDIAEAQDLASGEQKKAYYYDDFLGQISVGEKFNKNEEQRLLNFMEAIKKSKTSKLILTTREYILNQAKLLYEKIDRARFDPEICIVDLAKYTRKIRAQILFNHLYFSDLPRPYLEALIANRVYLKIVDHENYNPRIIEQMTQPNRIRDVEPVRYGEIFLHNLTNPAEIWRHAFEQQLSEASRSTLLVMATSFAATSFSELQESVEAFHFAKCRHFGISSGPRDFNRAVKELEGNFVTTAKQIDATDKEVITISYHNPSVRDFVRNYLATADYDLELLIQTAVFFEQLMNLWRYRDDTPSGKLFAEALKAHVGKLVRSAVRALYSNEVTTWPRYRTWRKPATLSFEQRVSFLIRMSSTAPQEDISDDLDAALVHVRKRLTDDVLDGDELVSLLAELAKLNRTSLDRHVDLVNETYEYVSADFDSFDAFQPFLAFADAFPDRVPNEKMEEASQDFQSLAEDAGDGESDPDRVRELATQVEDLGARFGVETSSYVDGLEEWAKECERNSTQSEYDDDDWRPASGTEFFSDTEIDSLFSTL